MCCVCVFHINFFFMINVEQVLFSYQKALKE